MDNTTKNTTELRYFAVSKELAQKKWSNSSVVLVYGLMLNRYNFFIRNKKKDQKNIYFESQKNIAEQLGMSERTVTSCISLLKEHGYITYELIRQGNSFKNSYIVNDVHKLANNSEEIAVKSRKSVVKPAPSTRKVDESIPEWMRDDNDDRF